MHTVIVFQDALAAARRLGYRIRQEWLAEVGGGPCEFGGQRWLFIDLSQTAAEQLEEVLHVLRTDPASSSLDLSPVLRRLCESRRAA